MQLTGGNDGLNTVIPFKNETYYKLRPTLAIPKDQVKKLTDDLGLHPAMGELAKLHTDESAVCVVQGVGYPNPSQSHFRSMDIWHAASTAENLTDGWPGRAIKSKPTPAFAWTSTNWIDDWGTPRRAGRPGPSCTSRAPGPPSCFSSGAWTGSLCRKPERSWGRTRSQRTPDESPSSLGCPRDI